ncbi:MAG TPA: oxidoreductase [Methanocorpusculum sp.]|nr:oxidoreductase [Methanocorpusculum sp.]HJJ57835.1 oxidoreductase [Methanocorpusculum sp.]
MHENISESRLGGCTLGGAIAVTAYIKNAITVVHAPKGCVHQTFSMYHAMLANESIPSIPTFVTSNLTDREVIFGGETALSDALDKATEKNPELILVISSCIPETIGDDCFAVCNSHKNADKIIYIPTSGFLGGKAEDGENTALISIAKSIKKQNIKPMTVAIIGEKNLESEIEENFKEISRLLKLLGITIIIRYCHAITKDEMRALGEAAFFISRDERVERAGTEIAKQFGRPLVQGYPSGLSSEIQFLKDCGRACNLSTESIRIAVETELNLQNEMLNEFKELRGLAIHISDEPFEGTYAVAKEVMERLNIREEIGGREVKLPFYLPVGIAGIRKMLYLWRREKRNNGASRRDAFLKIPMKYHEENT